MPEFYQGCKNDHQCEKQCFEPCPPCTIKVKKTYKNCTHYETMDCSKDLDNVPCKYPCKRTLECGHHCKLKCFEPCGNCKVKVIKEIPQCHHKIKMNCGDAADITNCYEKCKKILSCGHSCKNTCRDPCTTKCEVLVQSAIQSPCGHLAYVPCHLLHTPEAITNTNEFLDNCKELCNKYLQCGHKCAGLCSQCYQGRIHIPCEEKGMGNVLVCQHSCKVPCREYCPPCTEMCTYECVHSKCTKKCGVPCARGLHLEMRTKSEKKKKCARKCDRDPCNEPCKKKLPCDHDCVGLCGEPCPPICRICDEDELKTIFFGNEDEDDARFVVLEECGHVFEYQGLDDWFSMPTSSQEISPKQCPKCKSIINKTQRYATACKMAYEYIKKCKTKIYGLPKENDKKTAELRAIINDLIQKAWILVKIFSHDQALVAKNRLEKLLKTIEVVGEVSSEDKRMIVKAMGLKSGHWYACPQGHVYCITECGGAMQIAKCPECGASIGGTSHRLLSDNRVATEMDGATAPAWPQ
ncbi:NFX1-type zinc finger-containing protein 1-like [Ctenocephalides felis]|uniref:NFX1-type zinc finger-containing protein 1-like n=1 Tax=Ctenocephalides felis TaxID=7515 RepID=UPI000E6E2807|nr:NFX1-type zinc finger-containing protein 1-like [Ctenocephalides felis]